MSARPSFCSLQRDALLVLANAKKSRWKVPAQALYEAIAQQGWTLQQGPLRNGKFCLHDFSDKTLTLSSEADPELSPKAREKLLHWTLAIELGNIRYHRESGLTGTYGSTEEQVSVEYAMAFLLPIHLLREHPDVMSLLKTPSTLANQENWRRLLSRIADHFSVPPRCVQAALEHYGLLEPSRLYGWSSPDQRLA